jgi:hypothetical protein
VGVACFDGGRCAAAQRGGWSAEGLRAGGTALPPLPFSCPLYGLSCRPDWPASNENFRIFNQTAQPIKERDLVSAEQIVGALNAAALASSSGSSSGSSGGGGRQQQQQHYLRF